MTGMLTASCEPSHAPAAEYARITNARKACEEETAKQKAEGAPRLLTVFTHCLKENVMPLQLPHYAALEPQIRAMYDHMEEMAVTADYGGPVGPSDIVDYYYRQTLALGLQSPTDCAETSGQMQCHPHQATRVPILRPHHY